MNHPRTSPNFSAMLVALLSGASAATSSAASRPPAVRTNADLILTHDPVDSGRKLLSPEEIAQALQQLPGWNAEQGRLTKTFVQQTFGAAIAFINALAPECERLDRHPEIFAAANKVNLVLTTPDAGGRISSHDVLLAGRIESIAGTLLPR